jgi:hypothetical protein
MNDMQIMGRDLYYCYAFFMDVLKETTDILGLPVQNLTQDIQNIRQEC